MVFFSEKNLTAFPVSIFKNLKYVLFCFSIAFNKVRINFVVIQLISTIIPSLRDFLSPDSDNKYSRILFNQNSKPRRVRHYWNLSYSLFFSMF
jgi:hypothetical protein